MKTIPLADSRFAAIALASTPAVRANDLSQIVAPTAAVSTAPVSVSPAGGAQDAPQVRRDGNKAYFKVGDLADGSPAEIAVHIENETLAFFPERSSAHRQILATLGIDE